MNFDDIFEKLNRDVYDNDVKYPDHIKLVKPILSRDSVYYVRVHEEYAKEEEILLKLYKIFKEAENEAYTKFRNDNIEVIQTYKITKKQAEKIFGIAWKDARSGGHHSVIDKVKELCEVFED